MSEMNFVEKLPFSLSVLDVWSFNSKPSSISSTRTRRAISPRYIPLIIFSKLQSKRLFRSVDKWHNKKVLQAKVKNLRGSLEDFSRRNSKSAAHKKLIRTFASSYCRASRPLFRQKVSGCLRGTRRLQSRPTLCWCTSSPTGIYPPCSRRWFQSLQRGRSLKPNVAPSFMVSHSATHISLVSLCFTFRSERKDGCRVSGSNPGPEEDTQLVAQGAWIQLGLEKSVCWL